MISIYFQNKEEENICAFHNFSSIPFKEGDQLTLKIKNNNKEIWNVQELDKNFKIDKIENIWELHYPLTNEIDRIKQHIFAFITVSEI